MGEATLIASTAKLTRQQLAAVATPLGTATHRPVPHAEIVEALVETLSFRHIGVVQEEYAVSKDGMKMFGVLDLDTGMPGCRFSIGVRNSHDQSMRLAAVVGVRVLVCENMAFSGDFQPVLAKHSKHFSLPNALSIGVDQMQRNFAGMQQAGRGLETVPALGCFRKDDHLPCLHRGMPWRCPSTWLGRSMICTFRRRTRNSSLGRCGACSNAFTSAFKELEPIPQFKATAKLAGFLERS